MAPLIYLADESPVVQTILSDELVALGISVYIPSSANDPDNPTSFIGGFKCALLDLENPQGTDDPFDTAELLRVYHPTLPVAFLHEGASDKLVKRAEILGPVFRKPTDLANVLAWVRECARL